MILTTLTLIHHLMVVGDYVDIQGIRCRVVAVLDAHIVVVRHVGALERSWVACCDWLRRSWCAVVWP